MRMQSLIPWKKDDEVNTFQKAMNDLFDEFWNGRELMIPENGKMWPRLDVTEDEHEVKVVAELPGMGDKDVTLTLQDNVLCIKGEKKQEKEEKKKDYHRMERSYGSFQRSIALPAEVDEAKVNAVFKNGELTVTMTKTPSAQKAARKIDIKVV